MALSRVQLDAAGCGQPNCTHDHTVLSLVSRCHTSKGTEVKYDKRTGTLTIRCKVCKALVAEVLVAATVGNA